MRGERLLEIELRALNVADKEAIARCGQRWCRLCQTNNWRPEDLGDREPPFCWGAPFVRVRKVYGSFGALVSGVEAVLLSGAQSPEEIRVALLRRTDSRGNRGDAGNAWREDCRALLSLFQGRLDALFTGRGCSAEEAFPLILETFRRLYFLGPLALDQVEARLPHLAAEVFREQYGDVIRSQGHMSPGEKHRGSRDDSGAASTKQKDGLRCLKGDPCSR